MEGPGKGWKREWRALEPWARGMTSEERKAPRLTPGQLNLDAEKKKRIQLLHLAVWARQTTRRLAAEFERIQKFLASPVSQQIEQDLARLRLGL